MAFDGMFGIFIPVFIYVDVEFVCRVGVEHRRLIRDIAWASLIFGFIVLFMSFMGSSYLIILSAIF